MSDFDTLQQIVEWLELCGFKDEVGHDLKMNQAFISLKEKASKDHKVQSVLNLLREVTPSENVACRGNEKLLEISITDANGYLHHFGFDEIKDASPSAIADSAIRGLLENGGELKVKTSLNEKVNQSLIDVKLILKLIHEKIPLEKGNHNFQIDAECGELVLWILIGEKWQSVLFNKDDGEKPANLIVDGIIESLINAGYKI